MILFLSVDVYAQKYTDYEFVGYTEEKKENDEFYKYEQTKLNRFYKLTETNVGYVRIDDPYDQEHMDLNDWKWGDVISTNKNLPYENKTRVVTLRVDDNYLTHRVEIKNLKNFNRMDKIEVWANDVLIKTLSKSEIQTENFEITFPENTLQDITVTFHYTSEVDLEFDLSISSDTSYRPLTKHLTLEHRYRRFSINALTYKDFDDFITKYSLMSGDETYYFKYNVKIYRVYDLEKIYFKDSEDTEMEGYEYDETESYIAYRIYKREKLPDTGESTTDPEKPSPPSEDAPNTPPVGSNDSNVSNNPSKNEKPKTEPTTKKKKPTTTKKVSTIENENDNQNENDTLGQPYETVDNLSKTDLGKYESKNEYTECESKPQVNRFTVIGLMMILISLVITGIYYYRVNHT